VPFDVLYSGLNSQSDDDFSHLKTTSNGYKKVILWIVGTAMPWFLQK
jgi:hypothetical protein